MCEKDLKLAREHSEENSLCTIIAFVSCLAVKVKEKLPNNFKCFRTKKNLYDNIGNSKLCMDHRNKTKVPDPVVKDLTSKN